MLAELGQLGVELGLQAGLELLQEINGGGGVLGHLDFDLVIGPGLVAELVGNVVAQGQDLLQQRDVVRAGQVVVLGDQPLARFLAFGVVHHADVMPGDVRHDGVFVGAGLDLRQEALGHAFQFGLGELHGLLGLRDVGLVIGRQPASAPCASCSTSSRWGLGSSRPARR